MAFILDIIVTERKYPLFNYESLGYVPIIPLKRRKFDRDVTNSRIVANGGSVVLFRTVHGIRHSVKSPFVDIETAIKFC